MKVLLINGSPDMKGCTYTALSEVAPKFQECGDSPVYFASKNGTYSLVSSLSVSI